MWRTWVGIGLVCAVVAAETDAFEKGRRTVSQRFVRDVGKLARQAKRENAHWEAVLAWRSILRETPDHAVARRALGFRKRKGAWERDPEVEKEIVGRRDSDHIVARRIRRGRERVERRRVDALIELCGLHSTDARARPLLLGLLEADPRNPKLHLALGHERIGDSYVRPELVPVVRNMSRVVARWQAHAQRRPRVVVSKKSFSVPGYLAFPAMRIGKRTVVHDGPSLNAQRIAAGTAIADRFIGELLGLPGANWQPAVAVFVKDGAYERIIHHIVPDPRDKKLALRFASFNAREFWLWKAETVEWAIDGYAHRSAFHTVSRLAAPVMPGQAPDTKNPARDDRANAWLKEGMAYLATLELFDTAITHFVSGEGTGNKRYTSKAPSYRSRSREVTTNWVADQVRANNHYPLSKLVGMSLNNLDDMGALQAYTVVRFLFFLDADGVGDFCRALADQTAGSPAERVDKALRRALGTSLADVETMWRSFLLEIRQR